MAARTAPEIVDGVRRFADAPACAAEIKEALASVPPAFETLVASFNTVNAICFAGQALRCGIFVSLGSVSARAEPSEQPARTQAIAADLFWLAATVLRFRHVSYGGGGGAARLLGGHDGAAAARSGLWPRGAGACRAGVLAALAAADVKQLQDDPAWEFVYEGEDVGRPQLSILPTQPQLQQLLALLEQHAAAGVRLAAFKALSTYAPQTLWPAMIRALLDMLLRGRLTQEQMGEAAQELLSSLRQADAEVAASLLQAALLPAMPDVLACLQPRVRTQEGPGAAEAAQQLQEAREDALAKVLACTLGMLAAVPSGADGLALLPASARQEALAVLVELALQRAGLPLAKSRLGIVATAIAAEEGAASLLAASAEAACEPQQVRARSCSRLSSKLSRAQACLSRP